MPCTCLASVRQGLLAHSTTYWLIRQGKSEDEGLAPHEGDLGLRTETEEDVRYHQKATGQETSIVGVKGVTTLKRGSEFIAEAKAGTEKAKAAAIEQEAKVRAAASGSSGEIAGTVKAADSRTKPANGTKKKKTKGVAAQFPGAPKSGANGGQQPVFRGEYKGLS